MPHSVRERATRLVFPCIAVAFATGAALGQKNDPAKVPSCNAGADQVVDCTGVSVAVGLDGTGSTSPLKGDLSYRWEWCNDPRVSIDDLTNPTATLYFDMLDTCQVACQVTLIASNSYGDSVCSTSVSVQDATPPSLECPESSSVPHGDPTDPGSTGFATATDACNPSPTVSYVDDLSQGPATILRTWTADDGCQTSNCLQTITLLPPEGPHFDLRPGECPNEIWVGQSEAAVVRVRGSLLGNAFDVTQVDVGSLTIEHGSFLTGVTGQVEPDEVVFEDIATPFIGDPCGCNTLGGDEYLDLTLYFDREELIEGLALDEIAHGTVIELRVVGRLLDEQPFSATDCIKIVHFDE